MTIPAGFAQCEVRFGGMNAPTGASVIFGVRLDDPLDIPAAVCNFVRNAWAANLLDNQTDDISLVAVRTKFGPDDTGPFAEVAFNDPGTVVATATPPNTAYLVTKGTAVGGRRGKGRMFVPGLPEVSVDDSGTITQPSLGTIQGRFDGFLGDLATASIPMVLLHEPATVWTLVNGQPRRVPLPGPVPSPDEVTSLNVAARVGTQRRRLRR